MTRVPDEILDKHLGILGINGSGKTYTAKGLAERLLDQNRRICVIDPVGVWFGLKSSATGKSAGYPLVIFGGHHADVQIGSTHGEAIAEAIGTSSTSAIIDTSLMRTGERTRFFADFADALRVKNQGPLHLFIDEAHLFMPQGRVADPQSANMLHAANNLISLGRARGLRITIISQRPAKIHKDSLTQVHSLIAMRLIAPQDRAAVEAWIADQADIQKGKQIIASLPSLKTGEGWLWAPEIDILEKIKFPKISTFDSSRSPDGETGAKIVLAPINLDAIQGKLAGIKQEKISNDPVALKRQIAELHKQLSSSTPNIDAAEHDKAIRQAKAQGYSDGVADCAVKFEAKLESALAIFTKAVTGLSTDKAVVVHRAAALKEDEKPRAASKPVKPAQAATPIPLTDIDGLSGPQSKILASLQFWKTIGHDAPSRAQVAAVAGYSARGGAFARPMGELKTAGLVSYTGHGGVRLGATAGNDLTMMEARDAMISVLSGPQRAILAACAASAEPQTREAVAEAAGYSMKGGAFARPTGELCTLGILEKSGPGMLAVTDWARELLT